MFLVALGKLGILYLLAIFTKVVKKAFLFKTCIII